MCFHWSPVFSSESNRGNLLINCVFVFGIICSKCSRMSKTNILLKGIKRNICCQTAEVRYCTTLKPVKGIRFPAWTDTKSGLRVQPGAPPPLSIFFLFLLSRHCVILTLSPLPFCSAITPCSSYSSLSSPFLPPIRPLPFMP